MHMQPGIGTLPDSTMRRGAAAARALWAGRGIGSLAALFLMIDSVGKLLEVPAVVEGAVQLGYDPAVVSGLGITLSSCVLLYVVRRTSVLGAVLLTGYLGGATATHVRVGSPLFTHVLFPVYVAALLWASLILRDPRLWLFTPWPRRSER